jgi:hypothetical protein
MNKEKQRIAIAEACGMIGPFENHEEWFENGDSDGWIIVLRDATGKRVANYLNDLNAVHDFVSQKFKSKFMLAEYEYRLRACLADGRPAFEVAGYELANATAAQKAEALLKALNLWGES